MAASAEYAVRCPRCGAQAVAVMVPDGTKGTYREVLRKLGAALITCAHCRFFCEKAPGGRQDYELWYVAKLGGRRLWATNRKQLDFLIDWLAHDGKMSGRSLADMAYLEALPKWFRAGKNRAAILARLRRLRGDGDDGSRALT